MRFRKIFIKSSIFFLGIGILSSAYLTYKILYDCQIPQKFFIRQSDEIKYSLNLNNVHSFLLEKYYLSFIHKRKSTVGDEYGVDENGIRLVNYGGDIGTQYNPVSISQYALGNYELWLDTKEKKYREVFLKQADWLVRNQKITDKGFGVWEYKFDWKPYRLEAPWISAMAQGEAMSVLLRAYQLTQNESYLKAAKKALDSFDYLVKEGGVKTIDSLGNVWYQEYPSKPPSYVLNGFIFALFGIYDFYRVTKDAKALALFNEGIKTLENRLALYDTGCWTTYNLIIRDRKNKVFFEDPRISNISVLTFHYGGSRELASKSYHNLHIAQLRVLYKITSKDIFKNYAEKWIFYRDGRFSR